MPNFADDAHPESGACEGAVADGTPESTGKFHGGMKQGEWKFFYRNGRLKALGVYDDGKLTGHWVWWRQNGQRLQEGAFAENRQVGPWKRWFDNGQLWDEGTYNDDGKKVGEWTTYNRDGAVKSTRLHRGPRS